MLPISDELEVKYLSKIFENKSECYKLFWFEAIVKRISQGKNEMTFQELLHEMIVSAWYMVTEYHLNLGPADTLENLIHRIYEVSEGALKSSDAPENIIHFVETCGDSQIRTMMITLTKNVPYRLHAPFVDHKIKGKDWNVPLKQLAQRINLEDNTIYQFGRISPNALNNTICIRPKWLAYIEKNTQILQGWIEYNKIMYLQRRNPSVPGIAHKLYPNQERDLKDVKKFWKTILSIQPMNEIYKGNLLTIEDALSIDHFIPWSYVAHDELWNLHPTTKNINSSKSNNLPKWEKYFEALSTIQYEAYQCAQKNEQVHIAFDKCIKKHVNEDEIRRTLYQPNIPKAAFQSKLSEILSPIYNAAEKMGFKAWEC